MLAVSARICRAGSGQPAREESGQAVQAGTCQQAVVPGRGSKVFHLPAHELAVALQAGRQLQGQRDA